MTTVVFLLMLAALVCSHFFSASETAFFSLKKTDLVSLGRSGDERSGIVSRLLENPDDLLVAILFGNVVVNVFYASLSVIAAYDITDGDTASVVAVESCALIVLILVGEIVPKYIALSNPSKMSLSLARPMELFGKAARPATVLAGAISGWFADMVVPQRDRPEVTSEEFDAILRVGEDQGVIDSAEEDYLQGVMDMEDIRVSAIMTPRVDVGAVDVQDSREDVARLARESRFAKLPVYEEDIDNIIGIIHVKDLIFGVGTGVRDIVRPVGFVPESMLVADLVVRMRKENENLVVVVDEHGGTAGVVSLEDAMEEVVGEIEDEYDHEEPDVRQLEPGKFEVDGSMAVHDWNERFGTHLDEEGVDTIAGYMMSELGRPPAEGDSIVCGELTLTVTGAEGRRVVKILVRQENGQ